MLGGSSINKINNNQTYSKKHTTFPLAGNTSPSDFSDYYNSLIRIRYLLLNYFKLRECVRTHSNENLLCVLADIDTALSNIELNKQDMEVLDKYMNGYSFSDIGKIHSFTKSNADFTIKKITKRIRDYLIDGGYES